MHILDYPATYSELKKLRSRGTKKKPLTLDEKVERDTKRLVKRFKLLEQKGITYKESKTARERNRRIQEKINLRLKKSYIERYKNGEIKLEHLPKDLFPKLFEQKIKIDDRANWKNHIHHHIRCELMDNDSGINVFCHTCVEEDNYDGKLITNFYKSDEDL